MNEQPAKRTKAHRHAESSNFTGDELDDSIQVLSRNCQQEHQKNTPLHAQVQALVKAWVNQAYNLLLGISWMRRVAFCPDYGTGKVVIRGGGWDSRLGINGDILRLGAFISGVLGFRRVVLLDSA